MARPSRAPRGQTLATGWLLQLLLSLTAVAQVGGSRPSASEDLEVEPVTNRMSSNRSSVIQADSQVTTQRSNHTTNETHAVNETHAAIHLVNESEGEKGYRVPLSNQRQRVRATSVVEKGSLLEDEEEEDEDTRTLLNSKTSSKATGPWWGDSPEQKREKMKAKAMQYFQDTTLKDDEIQRVTVGEAKDAWMDRRQQEDNDLSMVETPEATEIRREIWLECWGEDWEEPVCTGKKKKKKKKKASKETVSEDVDEETVSQSKKKKKKKKKQAESLPSMQNVTGDEDEEEVSPKKKKKRKKKAESLPSMQDVMGDEDEEEVTPQKKKKKKKKAESLPSLEDVANDEDEDELDIPAENLVNREQSTGEEKRFDKGQPIKYKRKQYVVMSKKPLKKMNNGQKMIKIRQKGKGKESDKTIAQWDPSIEVVGGDRAAKFTEGKVLWYKNNNTWAKLKANSKFDDGNVIIQTGSKDAEGKFISDGEPTKVVDQELLKAQGPPNEEQLRLRRLLEEEDEEAGDEAAIFTVKSKVKDGNDKFYKVVANSNKGTGNVLVRELNYPYAEHKFHQTELEAISDEERRELVELLREEREDCVPIQKGDMKFKKGQEYRLTGAEGYNGRTATYKAKMKSGKLKVDLDGKDEFIAAENLLAEPEVKVGHKVIIQNEAGLNGEIAKVEEVHQDEGTVDVELLGDHENRTKTLGLTQVTLNGAEKYNACGEMQLLEDFGEDSSMLEDEDDNVMDEITMHKKYKHCKFDQWNELLKESTPQQRHQLLPQIQGCISDLKNLREDTLDYGRSSARVNRAFFNHYRNVVDLVNTLNDKHLEEHEAMDRQEEALKLEEMGHDIDKLRRALWIPASRHAHGLWPAGHQDDPKRIMGEHLLPYLGEKPRDRAGHVEHLLSHYDEKEREKLKKLAKKDGERFNELQKMRKDLRSEDKLKPEDKPSVKTMRNNMRKLAILEEEDASKFKPGAWDEARKEFNTAYNNKLQEIEDELPEEEVEVNEHLQNEYREDEGEFDPDDEGEFDEEDEDLP